MLTPVYSLLCHILLNVYLFIVLLRVFVSLPLSCTVCVCIYMTSPKRIGSLYHSNNQQIVNLLLKSYSKYAIFTLHYMTFSAVGSLSSYLQL